MGVVWALLVSAQVRDTLTRAGIDPERAETIAESCNGVAHWMVMNGVDLRRPGPLLDTVDGVVELARLDDLARWRGQVALIAANPWGGYAESVATLLREAGLETAATWMEECAAIYQDRVERHERLEIARSIRRMVEATGLRQREFAKLVGTSASRLSTYMNAVVTPSAAMMLRITRVARQLSTDEEQ